MLTLPIELPLEQITEFCQRNPIRKLSLFGSILRDDFKPESDVDMLVEFIPDSRVGYFELIGMEVELTEMLKRKVDLRTPAEISRYFRQRVLDSAQVIYEHR
ncbi:MAG: nucleotidyltransferase family protein [Myxacorys californica WJT36-NPBG1]|jgi:hypothetical protein|nr:nucleotidyltransferase family protein [Myxacorys californica WJT36-NPBG1]